MNQTGFFEPEHRTLAAEPDRFARSEVEPRSGEEADDTAQALDFVQRLYREIHALRVYEGTSEIQKEIIAHQLLKAADE